MTEQQACTLCGAGGHLAAQCHWRTDAALDKIRSAGLTIDGDNAYKRDILDCVVGALAFGKQGSTPPPDGHWGWRFYEIGKAEAAERARDQRIMCAMALSISAVGEALGIPGEQQEGGTGEFIDIIEEMKAAQGPVMAQAWLDVQEERRRQIEAEGWTPEHDDKHGGGQMARAAACYALAGSCSHNDETAALLVDLAWPWTPEWWKPSTSRRDLVKAAALILAELERLDRAAAPAQGGCDE